MGHSKAILRGKFTAMSAHIINTERSQVSDLILHLKLLEKQEQVKPKTSRREIIKIRAEINKIRDQKRKTIQKINETKIWFVEKISKIDKTLAN
jgi:hypothetical protein